MRQLRMRPGMVAYNMSLPVFFLYERWIVLYQVAYFKKGGFYIILLQDMKYLRRVDGIRAVVEGERDFRQMTIAAKKRGIERGIGRCAGSGRCRRRRRRCGMCNGF